MTIVFIEFPFFRSISLGWLAYYKRSSGPKFTEEQIRMADSAASILDDCVPVSDVIDPLTHSDICKKLGNRQFFEASRSLEMSSNLENAKCVEALKIGVWLLGTCAPESIRLATLNLLACQYYFPTI